MNKITSFEEACSVLLCSTEFPEFSSAPEKHKKALKAHYQLVLIIEAINNGWQPDWNDADESKYELWPDVVQDKSKPSGFGLSYDDYDLWTTFTRVGSRLCFKTREAARYCFETFKDLWEDYFLIG